MDLPVTEIDGALGDSETRTEQANEQVKEVSSELRREEERFLERDEVEVGMKVDKPGDDFGAHEADDEHERYGLPSRGSSDSFRSFEQMDLDEDEERLGRCPSRLSDRPEPSRESSRTSLSSPKPVYLPNVEERWTKSKDKRKKEDLEVRYRKMSDRPVALPRGCIRLPDNAPAPVKRLRPFRYILRLPFRSIVTHLTKSGKAAIFSITRESGAPHLFVFLEHNRTAFVELVGTAAGIERAVKLIENFVKVDCESFWNDWERARLVACFDWAFFHPNRLELLPDLVLQDWAADPPPCSEEPTSLFRSERDKFRRASSSRSSGSPEQGRSSFPSPASSSSRPLPPTSQQDQRSRSPPLPPSRIIRSRHKSNDRRSDFRPCQPHPPGLSRQAPLSDRIASEKSRGRSSSRDGRRRSAGSRLSQGGRPSQNEVESRSYRRESGGHVREEQVGAGGEAGRREESVESRAYVDANEDEEDEEQEEPREVFELDIPSSASSRFFPDVPESCLGYISARTGGIRPLVRIQGGRSVLTIEVLDTETLNKTLDVVEEVVRISEPEWRIERGELELEAPSETATQADDRGQPPPTPSSISASSSRRFYHDEHDDHTRHPSPSIASYSRRSSPETSSSSFSRRGDGPRPTPALGLHISDAQPRTGASAEILRVAATEVDEDDTLDSLRRRAKESAMRAKRKREREAEEEEERVSTSARRETKRTRPDETEEEGEVRESEEVKVEKAREEVPRPFISPRPHYNPAFAHYPPPYTAAPPPSPSSAWPPPSPYVYAGYPFPAYPTYSSAAPPAPPARPVPSTTSMPPRHKPAPPPPPPARPPSTAPTGPRAGAFGQFAPSNRASYGFGKGMRSEQMGAWERGWRR